MLRYPENLTIANMLYYLAVPTLTYQVCWLCGIARLDMSKARHACWAYVLAVGHACWAYVLAVLRCHMSLSSAASPQPNTQLHEVDLRKLSPLSPKSSRRDVPSTLLLLLSRRSTSRAAPASASAG